MVGKTVAYGVVFMMAYVVSHDSMLFPNIFPMISKYVLLCSYDCICIANEFMVLQSFFDPIGD